MTPTPILLCHGVGGGLLPYVPFAHLLASTGHPVVAVEFKHLAMRWTSFVPTVEMVMEGLVGILDAHRLGCVAAIGHSYGTFYCSRLVQAHPEKVRESYAAGMCFL